MIDYLNTAAKDLQYKKALFLDRDGTMIVDTVMPHTPENLIFFEDTFAALRQAGTLDAYLIVVTNQSGIALGKYTVPEMHAFNEIMLKRLKDEGVRIDALLYCPHYDKKNLPQGYGECMCSKPKPGMLMEARDLFDIRLEDSILIGDKHTDIGAGINAGCKETILVTTGIYNNGYKNEKLAAVYKPAHVAGSLTQAVQMAKNDF